MIIFNQEGDWIKPIIAEFGDNPLPSPCPPSWASQLRAHFLDSLPFDHWNKAKEASVLWGKPDCQRKSEERNLGRKRNQESWFLTSAFFFFGRLSKFIHLYFP